MTEAPPPGAAPLLPSSRPAPRALLADDEPVLAAALVAELSLAWPELSIVRQVSNGRDAIDGVFTDRPDIVFLDVRMPGASGLDVAQAIAEDWPDPAEGGAIAPLVVFVTAYGEFALDAFELAAVDYLLKPISARRLARTVDRLKAQLAARVIGGDDAALAGTDDIADLARRMRALLSAVEAPVEALPEPLTLIRAGVGDAVVLIPIDEVVLFEAADKYVVVRTVGREALIRESLRDLLPRLDAARFVRIHRGTIVNLQYVEAAKRSESSKLRLELRGVDTRPIVSRIYEHLFKAM